MSLLDQAAGNLIDQQIDDSESKSKTIKTSSDYVHIRNQQRNGKKSITTIVGLDPALNKKAILKAFKKAFNCNGNVVEDEDVGFVVQIQGDKRKDVQKFLIEEKIVSKNQVKVHGV